MPSEEKYIDPETRKQLEEEFAGDELRDKEKQHTEKLETQVDWLLYPILEAIRDAYLNHGFWVGDIEEIETVALPKKIERHIEVGIGKSRIKISYVIENALIFISCFIDEREIVKNAMFSGIKLEVEGKDGPTAEAIKLAVREALIAHRNMLNR